MKIPKEHIGYFDSPYPDAAPAYEPPFPVPCPYCGKKITMATVRTMSITLPPKIGEDKELSCFYRVHRACDDKSTKEQKGQLDEMVFKAMGIIAPPEPANDRRI